MCDKHIYGWEYYIACLKLNRHSSSCLYIPLSPCSNRSSAFYSFFPPINLDQGFTYPLNWQGIEYCQWFCPTSKQKLIHLEISKSIQCYNNKKKTPRDLEMTSSFINLSTGKVKYIPRGKSRSSQKGGMRTLVHFGDSGECSGAPVILGEPHVQLYSSFHCHFLSGDLVLSFP